MSEPLREVINLMAANIEEPLSQEQLAHYVGRSRRQIERLFQQQLGTTPVRYYLSCGSPSAGACCNIPT